jgi:hypothetical protein
MFNRLRLWFGDAAWSNGDDGSVRNAGAVGTFPSGMIRKNARRCHKAATTSKPIGVATPPTSAPLVEPFFVPLPLVEDHTRRPAPPLPNEPPSRKATPQPFLEFDESEIVQGVNRWANHVDDSLAGVGVVKRLMLIATLLWPVLVVVLAFLSYDRTMADMVPMLGYPPGMFAQRLGLVGVRSHESIIAGAFISSLVFGTTAWGLVMAFLGAIWFVTKR